MPSSSGTNPPMRSRPGRRPVVALGSLLVLGSSLGGTAEAAEGRLEALRRACATLDAVSVSWTECVRERASLKPTSVVAHDYSAHGDRIRHVAWSTSEGLPAGSMSAALSRAEWERLDSAARAKPPKIDMWDGIRHTTYALDRGGAYAATVLATRQDSRLHVRPLQGLLYYAETRLDRLGTAWQVKEDVGTDGTARLAFVAPSASFYLAFAGQGSVPAWSVLWMGTWEEAAARLKRATGLSELAAEPPMVAGYEVLQWQPATAIAEQLPLVVRQVLPHVQQDVLLRLARVAPRDEPVDVEGLPHELDGRLLVYSDEVTNEAFVRSKDGSREPLRKGSNLGGTGPSAPPPAPRLPPAQRPDAQEKGLLTLISRDWLFGGAAVLLVVGLGLSYWSRRLRTRPHA